MNPLTSSLTLDKSDIRLSDAVRAKLVVEGPAPLVVTAPNNLLADESAAAWRVRADGPAATETLPDGRQRWTQAYRLDPYQPGEPLTVRFAPFEAAAGTAPARVVEWPPQDVRVRTTLSAASADDARPVTPIEPLPPPPADDTLSAVVPAVSVLAVLLLVAAAVLVRKRRKAPPPTPAEWAAREFAAVERVADGRLFADRLADALRGYVERRFGLPAPRLTTAELLKTGEANAAWPADIGDMLRDVLERCDLAKFAGRVPDAAERAGLLANARRFVEAEKDPPAAAV